MTLRNQYTRQSLVSFVGIFSSGVPSVLTGRLAKSLSYKPSGKAPSDGHSIREDFAQVGRDMRTGINKAKEENDVE